MKAGQAVLEALRNAVHECTDSYEDHKRVLAALLYAAGVRTYSEYATGTRAIRVQAEPQSLSIIFLPYRNGGLAGRGRGFRPMQELGFSIPGNSARAHVGRAARTALAAAT